MKSFDRLDTEQRKERIYTIFSWVAICLLAFLFLFPLYWIITGSFKVKSEILSSEPVWFPSEWVLDNYKSLFSKRSAPLFEIDLKNLLGFKITG